MTRDNAAPQTGLDVRDLTVRYGGVLANDTVSLSVGPGRIVGLIGPNGAGKTTFIDAVTGFTPCTGEIVLGGRDLSGRPPHVRSRSGLTRTWQSGELFEDLSVRENVLVAARRVTARTVLADLVRPGRRREDGAVSAALELMGLDGLADRDVGILSLGQTKLLGVARALAGGPRVVLLDEPAAGLSAAESAELGSRLRRAAAGGVGILLVDHDMGLVFDVCDEVHVLEFGRVISHGTPAFVRADEAVLTAYLGQGAREGETA
ncbi:ABC transporter ATP-binding protein [Actinomadura sp. B10D3]|uniref:ABC transporter ATP-binding protein n=1 Tax=Actinomadura sp. B10D3 TaxID=3153557 RepID=UPI00325EA04E